MKYEVGQKLWLESTRSYGTSKYVTVTKVGRKWVHIDNGGRFDKATGNVDGHGYSPPGIIYASKELADEENARQSLWRELRHGMTYSRVGIDVTSDDIRKAAALLKVDIETK